MFLVDGSADGRVFCELGNWTGKACKIPRHLVRSSSDRKELSRAGVYFLFGRDEATNEIGIVYIGEAEEIYTHLMQHQDKEFWNEALVFVSKDENLNKAHSASMPESKVPRLLEATEIESPRPSQAGPPHPVTSIGQSTATKGQQYVPVIGIAHLWPLCALLEKLEQVKDKTVNEVQTSAPHNGYATAIVTISAFLIESMVGRAQHLKDIVPPKNPVAYLKQAPSVPDLADDIEELFVVRDIIAHNHLWDAEITFDQAGVLRMTSARLRDGYGDTKFHRVVNLETRRTRRLGLNAFPTRIWYKDAVIALKNLSLCLNHLDQQDERVLKFKEWPVTYRGIPIMFTDLVDSLETLFETH